MNSKRAYGQIFNLGSDEPISINGLARRIKELTKSASPIKHISYEEAYNKTFEDMRRRVPDIAKAKRFVGYRPAYSLKKTLGKVIAYYRGTHAAWVTWFQGNGFSIRGKPFSW